MWSQHGELGGGHSLVGGGIHNQENKQRDKHNNKDAVCETKKETVR